MQLELDSAQAFASNKRYVIERELGHGGMGVVYQALDLERNTRVALKALTQRDALNIYRLKNEFRQLADLSHPNLVALHELCNEGAAWFFTMELVNGKTFDGYVASERSSWPAPGSDAPPGRALVDASITLSQRAIGSAFPLPRVTCNIKRLRHALRQLVEAVAALHDAGKLHRDLKPSNVLVTPEGRVVVLDFGLVSNSTFVDPESEDAERTVGGCVFGTPAYMSPEQAAGEAITTASDWYAVGTMLYEALTGQLPFDGTVLEILRQKEDGEPLPASEIVKGVPDDLDELCRNLLQRDPAKRPSSTAILRALTGHSETPVIFDAQATRGPRSHGELFIGRERHIAELREAFEVAKTGRPITVLVHGQSGMGKSALVRCFANDLIRDEEAVVLRGRCYERETVPYKAFDNIIDALSRYLMRLPVDEAAQMLPRNVHALTVLFPVLKRVKSIAYARRPKYQTADARELRNQAFAALKDLLLRITDHHPLVINIDDLQWADMDSARLLSFIMGPPDPPPLLLIGSYRRDEADNSPFLKQILGERTLNEGAAEVREVRVDALSESEAQQFAGALLRDVPAINTLFSSSIAAEADGVPFFIAELAQHLRAHAERGELPVSMKPISLEQVILERVAGMSADAQSLLQVLSVAAGPIEQGVAIDAAGLPHGDRAAMLALRAARLIRTRGTRQADKAETYHDRVRESVVAAMEPEAIKQVHASIAHAMERYDIVDPERMVVHYSGAGDGMRAGETAVQAAHAAAKKLAFNRAAELYSKGIELLTKSAPTRHELYVHLGDALANAGRGAPAAEAYLKAAEGAESGEARKLQRMAAQQYLRSGKLNAGLPLTAEILKNVGISYPANRTAAIAQVFLEFARLATTPTRPRRRSTTAPSPSSLERLDTLNAVFREMLAIDPLVGTILQTRFLREALSANNPVHLMQATAWVATSTALTSGELKSKRVLALLAQAEELANELNDPYAKATLLVARAASAHCLGNFHGVEQAAAEAESIFRAECPGSSWEVTFARTWRYCAVELGGNLGIFAKEAPENERDAREKSDDYSLGFLALIIPMVQMMKDDPAAALSHLSEQAARLSGSFDTFHLWVMDRTADAHLYAGDVATASQYLNGLWPDFSSSLLFRARLLQVNAHFLRGRVAVANLRHGGDPHAMQQARQCIAKLRKCDRPDARVYGCLLSAAVAHVESDHNRAVHELQLAIAECESAGMHTFALYATRNLGLILGGSSGQHLVEKADAALTAMGVQCPSRWVATYAPGFS